ncbi:PREDICTED: uncharacterized protein LOC109239802 [Nicotiana attenuata]|uniref:uncharacterized protein LOC109239802 n=1 Tax=Nicotiana attenuata TaxID=49451 RepID=UPI0009046966|nr:PREDICTED: uncharacterized protein LOC109239802 [Nicotiana attenuata]
MRGTLENKWRSSLIGWKISSYHSSPSLLGAATNILPCPNDEVIKQGIFLSRIQQLDLIRDVTAEVMVAIKSMYTDKALGVDGFPIEFFTQHWDEVKDDVLADVLDFFRTGKMNRAINCTTITLIPKVPSPTQVKDYGPIACCTTLCKRITKVLSGRIKTIISDLVGGSQSAFIEVRSITDSILFTHELFKGYTRKGISARCMLKVILGRLMTL